MAKYIHIGFAKTGTSWLQAIVFPTWMKDNGVAYFTYRHDQEYTQYPSNKILISNENFSGGLNYDGCVLNAIENMVNLYGKDSIFLFSIRDPKRVSESLYRHRIIMNFKPYRKSSDDVLSTWTMTCQFLNSMNIRYHIFDTDSLDELAEFMEIEPPTEEQLSEWRKIRINTRQPKILIWFCLLINRLKLETIRQIILFILAIRWNTAIKRAQKKINRRGGREKSLTR